MMKAIGGGVGFLAGRFIGGIGIAALGGAIGIPAGAVAGICAVGGVLLGNTIENVMNK